MKKQTNILIIVLLVLLLCAGAVTNTQLVVQ